MDNIYIRNAKLDDCLKISEVKRQVWNTTYRGIYSDDKIDDFDIEKNSDKFKGIINTPDMDLFVLCKNDEIIGYMSCGGLFRPFKDYKQEIGLLYVLQGYQGLGLGKKLLKKGSEIIKSKGYKEFVIKCNKYNYAAQEFYKNMGGKIIFIDEDDKDKSIPQIVFLYQI
ncbi:MAG: GNAT family N-acetyltransferase [Clostridia bacterium]|nr:GNAT family N-acetyltransferase [Clostridia bacterium]